jgi:hypothetical protein
VVVAVEVWAQTMLPLVVLAVVVALITQTKLVKQEHLDKATLVETAFYLAEHFILAVAVVVLLVLALMQLLLKQVLVVTELHHQ